MKKPLTHGDLDISLDCSKTFQSTMELPFASVVVPTYNRPYDMLCECITALTQLHYPEFEIIIVDDGSTGVSVAKLVTELHLPDGVELHIHRIEHSGCPVARGTGFRIARGTVIATVDDDCIVDREWLRQVTAEFTDVLVGGVGGLTLSYFGAGVIARFCDATKTLREPIRSESGIVEGVYT